MKDFIERKLNNNKNKNNLKLTFINHKVFYARKSANQEVRVLRKDLNNIKIYALNCIIKAINNVLYSNRTILEAKMEFLNKFILRIKLNNTFKLYGRNYKKIYLNTGSDNFSSRIRSIYLTRDVYLRIFQLQKLFIIFEKYNHKFSRYMNYYNRGGPNPVKNTSQFNNNKQTSPTKSSNIYLAPSFNKPSDSLYYTKKKSEANNATFANYFLNLCFSKWKLTFYKHLTDKISFKKALITLVNVVENLIIIRLKENKGLYHLVSFKKENENDKKKVAHDKQRVDNKSTGLIPFNIANTKKKALPRLNRLNHLIKSAFFENLKKKVFFDSILNSRINSLYSDKNIIFSMFNIFEAKNKIFKKSFFTNLKIWYDNKNQLYEKTQALGSIIEVNRLSSILEVGSTRSLLEFVRKYYNNITFRKNALQKYFQKWKDSCLENLNKIKIRQKHDYSIYINKSSLNNNEMNKLQGHNKSQKSEEKTNDFKTNYELNEDFKEKIINLSNSEFEKHFFKILKESSNIPRAKILFFLRKKINENSKMILNHYFKKLRIKLNMYYVYNKLLAAEFNQNIINSTNNNKANSEKDHHPNKILKDESYFLSLAEKNKVRSLPEQLGNKIKITESEKHKEMESCLKIASISRKLRVQTIDYLINQNQSKVILDYENDELKLDRDVTLVKKLITDKSYLQLTRVLFLKKIKIFRHCFEKWKNISLYSANQLYEKILENFENAKNENDILINSLNKTRSEYKKLIHDFKLLKNYFCENCTTGGEDFVLDMKSINSDISGNDITEYKAEQNYNSEAFVSNMKKSKIFIYHLFK